MRSTIEIAEEIAQAHKKAQDNHRVENTSGLAYRIKVALDADRENMAAEIWFKAARACNHTETLEELKISFMAAYRMTDGK